MARRPEGVYDGRGTAARGSARAAPWGGCMGLWASFVSWFRSLGQEDVSHAPAVATPVAPSVSPRPERGQPFANVEAFRQHIFEDYRFPPQARRILANVELVIHNMREP